MPILSRIKSSIIKILFKIISFFYFFLQDQYFNNPEVYQQSNMTSSRSSSSSSSNSVDSKRISNLYDKYKGIVKRKFTRENDFFKYGQKIPEKGTGLSGSRLRLPGFCRKKKKIRNYWAKIIIGTKGGCGNKEPQSVWQ